MSRGWTCVPFRDIGSFGTPDGALQIIQRVWGGLLAVAATC